MLFKVSRFTLVYVIIFGLLFSLSARSQDIPEEPIEPETEEPMTPPVDPASAPPPPLPKAEVKKPVATKTTAKPKAKKSQAQAAVIGPEGATIYQFPDFDSQVLISLSGGKKVIIAQKPVTGAGGLGLFYRVKYAAGKLGYVVDTEVIPQFKRNTLRAQKKTKNPVYDQVTEEQQLAKQGLDPIYFSRYFGAGLGSVDFTEKFAGGKLHEQVTMYSFRVTGPDLLFEGPPMDVHVGFSLNPPDYYKKYSVAAPSGFFIFGDISLFMPFLERPNSLLYYGLGMMMTYTKFKVKINNFDYIDSQEFRVGAVGDVGYAFRFGRWLARADVKYYFERTSYLGYWLTVQHQF